MNSGHVIETDTHYSGDEQSQEAGFVRLHVQYAQRYSQPKDW
jgi:hypothetical protein